jgi:hypothetical protein
VAERRPEQSVPGVQYWARPLAFEHGNLLSQGKDFNGRVASALAENANHREHRQDEFTHELSLNTALRGLANAIAMNLKPLIPQHLGVLSTHT